MPHPDAACSTVEHMERVVVQIDADDTLFDSLYVYEENGLPTNHVGSTAMQARPDKPFRPQRSVCPNRPIVRGERLRRESHHRFSIFLLLIEQLMSVNPIARKRERSSYEYLYREPGSRHDH